MVFDEFLFYLGVSVSNSRLETHFYSNWHIQIITIRFVEGKARVDIDHNYRFNHAI